MKLHILTLVLDGMPFLPMQLATLNRIDTARVDWHWTIVEGVAANTGSTKWCKPVEPRHSMDGSTELLNTWFKHPRITIRAKPFWPGGKDEMCNEALKNITEPCLLLQMDVDELWTPEQLVTLVNFFRIYQSNTALFFCRYFVGPNIVITSPNGYNGYGNRNGEWLRAFRYTPGMRWLSHEPPKLTGAMSPCATRETTKEYGLVFDHWAYALEKQVAFKEQFYGYTNAVEHWRRLQNNQIWPCDLEKFLPWVGSGVVADKLFK